jgi:hypothetical protein
MKKLNLIVGVLGTLAFLAAPPAWAQQQAPSGTPPQTPQAAAPAAPGKAAIGKKGRMYDPQTVETITGKVVSLKSLTARRPGRPARVSMLLNTDKGKIRVTLGPADYLNQQTLKPAVGDQVEVKGVAVTYHNRTSFIAGEVKKGDQVLKLRDEATGRPLWAKGKGRQAP